MELRIFDEPATSMGIVLLKVFSIPIHPSCKDRHMHKIDSLKMLVEVTSLVYTN